MSVTGSKTIASGTATACAASTIIPVLFAKLQFDSGNVNMHTGLGNITFGGDTYTGVGKLGTISTMDEVSDLSRTPVTLTLSGIPNDLISTLLSQQYQGRLATIFLGYLDTSAFTLVDTPITIYRGNMDTADFQFDKTSTISLSVESRFAAWDTPLVRRYNNSDQQARFPGDTGLEFIEQATATEIIWGATL